MSHDNDDEVYDITVRKFEDVTAFRNPESNGANRGFDDHYYRMYDEEADTLIYATAEGKAHDRSVTMALRDGTEAGFSA